MHLFHLRLWIYIVFRGSKNLGNVLAITIMSSGVKHFPINKQRNIFFLFLSTWYITYLGFLSGLQEVCRYNIF